VFDISFLDNPGIAWMMKLFITLILCSLIIGRIKGMWESWSKNKSIIGVIDEIVETIIMILIIVIIFTFQLSQMIGVLQTVWWFIYDTVISPIMRWLGLPV